MIRAANVTVNLMVTAVLVLLFALGCYALWDSHAIDSQADSVAWKPYKPVEPTPLSFWELQSINPEVRAWISVYGTNIDYPVCQSEDINKYLTTDPKGEYSLSGSLFLEPDASPDFTDPVTFVYGHHMEHGVMFGQVTDFVDQAFLDEHVYGNLFVNDQDWGIEFVCCVQADAYDTNVYRTAFASDEERSAYVDLLLSRAVARRNVTVNAGDRIVLLSTCSTATTNGRTILVGKVCDETFEDTFVTWPNTGTGVDVTDRGWFGLPWMVWILLAVAALLILALVVGSLWGRHARRRGQPVQRRRT